MNTTPRQLELAQSGILDFNLFRLLVKVAMIMTIAFFVYIITSKTYVPKPFTESNTSYTTFNDPPPPPF